MGGQCERVKDWPGCGAASLLIVRDHHQIKEIKELPSRTIRLRHPHLFSPTSFSYHWPSFISCGPMGEKEEEKRNLCAATLLLLLGVAAQIDCWHSHSETATADKLGM